jgi:rhodanese-related sulfurtransferase
MSFKHIGCDIFNEKIKSGDHILIDVRTPEEFNLGRLPGAAIIDFYGDNFQGELDKLDRDKKYLLYCRSGDRSGQAMMLMSSMGFKDVHHLENGIVSWMDEGFEIETE